MYLKFLIIKLVDCLEWQHMVVDDPLPVLDKSWLLQLIN